MTFVQSDKEEYNKIPCIDVSRPKTAYGRYVSAGLPSKRSACLELQASLDIAYSVHSSTYALSFGPSTGSNMKHDKEPRHVCIR